MAFRRRRVPGPAQSAGAPRLYEQRIGRFGPAQGTQYRPRRIRPIRNFGPGQPVPMQGQKMRPQTPPVYFKPTGPKAAPAGYPTPPGQGMSPAPQFPPRVGGGPPGPAAPGAGGQAPYLPLDAGYEAQRRAAEDALARAQSGATVERGDIEAAKQMFMARMATDQENATRQVNEAENARGLYNSGIRTTDVARSDFGFDRARQDQALTFQNMLRDIASREAEAQGSYQQSLLEALLGLGERQEGMYEPYEEEPEGLVGSAGRPPKKKKKKKKPRRK